MNWFAIGIDPLLVYLERRLQGILIYSLPTAGPRLRNGLSRWKGTLQHEDIPFPFMKVAAYLAMVGVELTSCWIGQDK